MSQQTQALPFNIVITYSLPALALAMLGISYFVYLPKAYADSLGISLAGMGLVIIATRVFDALIDPLVGSLSDRTRRGGRRKPLILFSFIPLVIAFLVLTLSGSGLFSNFALSTAGFLLWSILFFSAWTFYAVPYEALGTELSFNYDQRTTLFAWRDGMLVCGTLCAVIIFETFKLTLPQSGQALFYSALVTVTFLIISSLLLLIYVKENARLSTASKNTDNIWQAWSQAFKLPAFRVLLIAFLLNGFGAALPATLILFFVQYVLGQDIGGYYLLLYLLVGVLSFPVWARLSKGFDKKFCWLLAGIINSGAFGFTLFLGVGDFLLFALICIISGVGFAGVMLIPSSMQADVIDYAEQESGQRCEGAFVGIWSVARKLSAAVGAGIAFPILELVGFVPGSVQQSYQVLATLSGLYAGVPVVCTLISLYFISAYPLSKKDHLAASQASAEKWINTTKNGAY